MFDSSSAAGRKNNDWCPGRVIDGKGKKKFALDREFLFYQHRFDGKLANFHLQHARGVPSSQVWLFCERNSSNAGTPGRPSLDLDHNAVVSVFGRTVHRSG